jgi:hypothetical protein
MYSIQISYFPPLQDYQALMTDVVGLVRKTLNKYKDSLIVTNREDTLRKRKELKGALRKVYTCTSCAGRKYDFAYAIW